MNYCSTLVPLREAYNHIGMLEHGTEWTGEEAKSIAPGKRSSYDPRIWKRGRSVWSIMMGMIEAERLPLIVHLNGYRVRYGSTAIRPITNLYPCPTNDPNIGFVELCDQDIYYAIADVSGLPKPKLKPKARTGPKPKFDHFSNACLDQFRQFGLHQSLQEVRVALNAREAPPHPWPKRTREIEIIDAAREAARKEIIGIENTGK